MADNYKVGIEITADSKSAQSGLNLASLGLENLSEAAKQASKVLDGLEKNFDNIGSGLQNFGSKLSLYVTAPLAAFGALAVKEFLEAEKELSQLNIALANSGTYSAAAVKQFQALADELERTTNFSGGTITSASAMALNFSKTTEQAERLVRAAADLSSATGIDLNSAIQGLGQSLTGVSGSLARSLPQLRNLTEEQLKAGDAIDYVEQRFSGSALAATRNLTGELTRLKNGFQAFLEEVGSQFAPFLYGITQGLNQFLSYLRGVDPVVRNTVIAFGIFAAAIGPLLVGLGLIVKTLGVAIGALKVLAPVLTIVAKGFAVLTSPITIIIALGTAVAGLVNVILSLQRITGSWSKAFTLSFQLAYQGFLRVFVAPFLSAFDMIFSTLGQLPGLGALARSGEGLRSWRESIVGELSSTLKEMNDILATEGSSVGNEFTFGLKDKFSSLWDSMSEDFNERFSLPVVDGFENVNKVGVEIADQQEKKTKKLTEKQDQYAQTISSSFANAFGTIADGTKSVGQAFSDMASSIIQDLSRMILQQAIYNAIAGFLSPTLSSGTQAPASNFNPAFTAATGGFFNGRDITHRYASGGMVSGPGTGTSDSILARLSNGEFVSDANTTSFFGADFFLNLKRMARSGNRPSPIMNGIPAFANGGLVSGQGMGETRVVIQNSGSPKEARNVSVEQDAQGTVVNIILEDISRNGSISKSFQNNFGVRRSGV